MDDIWAVGGILLEMMSGYLIPDMINDSNVFALSNQFDELVEQICEDYDNISIETVAKSFLKKDPKKRMSIDQALVWFNKPLILPPISKKKNFFSDRPWTR